MASDDSDVNSSDEEEDGKQLKKKKKKSSSQMVTMPMINRWSRDMRVSGGMCVKLRFNVQMCR